MLAGIMCLQAHGKMGVSISRGPETGRLLPKCRGFLSHAEAPWKYMTFFMLKLMIETPVSAAAMQKMNHSVFVIVELVETCMRPSS